MTRKKSENLAPQTKNAPLTCKIEHENNNRPTGHAMNERQATTLSSSFNGSVRIEGREERLTGDAGVIALREADERLGFSEWLADQVIDFRDQRLITHPLVELLRSRLYLMAQGRRD